MSAKEIAEKLYEMSLDMDWMDYAETREETISGMTKEIESIDGTVLRNVLEIIAEFN